MSTVETAKMPKFWKSIHLGVILVTREIPYKEEIPGNYGSVGTYVIIHTTDSK